MSLPEAPQGVALVAHDGTRLPCRLAFQGRNAEGFNVWLAVPREPRPGVVVVEVWAETLPPLTAITVPHYLPYVLPCHE